MYSIHLLLQLLLCQNLRWYRSERDIAVLIAVCVRAGSIISFILRASPFFTLSGFPTSSFTLFSCMSCVFLEFSFSFYEEAEHFALRRWKHFLVFF